MFVPRCPRLGGRSGDLAVGFFKKRVEGPLRFVVLLSVTLTCTFATVAEAQPTYLQSSCFGPESGKTFELALPRPTQARGLFLVAISVEGAETKVASMTDTLGHLYEPVSPLHYGGFNWQTQVWFARGGADGGVDALLVALDQPGRAIVYFHEYGGFEAGVTLDGMSSAKGVGEEMNSGPLTTTSAPELLFAFGASFGTVGSAPPGFTPRERCSNDMSADLVASTPGTFTAVFLQPPGAWTSTLLAFKVGDRADGGQADGGQPDGGQAMPDGGAVVEAGPVVFHTCACSSTGGLSLLVLVLCLRAGATRIPAKRARTSALPYQH